MVDSTDLLAGIPVAGAYELLDLNRGSFYREQRPGGPEPPAVGPVVPDTLDPGHCMAGGRGWPHKHPAGEIH